MALAAPKQLIPVCGLLSNDLPRTLIERVRVICWCWRVLNVRSTCIRAGCCRRLGRFLRRHDRDGTAIHGKFLAPIGTRSVRVEHFVAFPALAESRLRRGIFPFLFIAGSRRRGVVVKLDGWQSELGMRKALRQLRVAQCPHCCGEDSQKENHEEGFHVGMPVRTI